MSQADTQREALRLRSVGDVIHGYNVRSEIARREIAGELDKQQIANLRAVEPHLAAEILARIDQHKEAAGASRAARVSTETLLPEKVAQERAQTAQYQAQTKSTLELLSYQKRNLDANIAQSFAAAGASNANAERIRATYPKEVALLEKQNAEYVPMQIDGKQYTAKGMDLAKQRADIIEKMITKQKDRDAAIRQSRLDDNKALEDSSNAEFRLKTYMTGKNKITAEQALPDADMFHALSKKPYVYILEAGEKGKIWDGSATLKPIQLPKVDGHQYTAREVYDAAVEMNMSTQEYMEKYFYPNLRMPVPWRTSPEPK